MERRKGRRARKRGCKTGKKGRRKKKKRWKCRTRKRNRNDVAVRVAPIGTPRGLCIGTRNNRLGKVHVPNHSKETQEPIPSAPPKAKEDARVDVLSARAYVDALKHPFRCEQHAAIHAQRNTSPVFGPRLDDANVRSHEKEMHRPPNQRDEAALRPASPRSPSQEPLLRKRPTARSVAVPS